MAAGAALGGRVSAAPATGGGRWTVPRVGLVLGPSLFALLVLLPTGSLAGDPKRLAAVALWMACWWATEAVPLAATSMLPLVLLPLLGLRGVGDVAASYGDDMVFLFLGGFVLALAVERSGLHRRVALAVLDVVGPSPRRQLWGFLAVTAAASMWLSNTATTLMMLPIAAGVADRLGGGRVATRLMLAIAYGASIGGMGTLVGTPPNLVLAGMAPTLVEGLRPLTFAGWLLFGVPVVLVLLPATGLLLGHGLRDEVAPSAAGLAEERAGLGPVRPAERRAAVLFGVTALAWITRTGFELGAVTVPGWGALLGDPAAVSDAVPAIAAAIVATLLPSGEPEGGRLLSWEQVGHGVPWGVLLLFGGGFALADAVRATGLDGWLAGQLEAIAGWPLVAVVLVVCTLTTFATELTSNTATATLLMPIMAALAGALDQPPYLLMVPAVLSASCAFMLPVATPPNAIVIGSGRVSAREMFRFGLWMNLIGVVVISALVLTLGRLVLPL